MTDEALEYGLFAVNRETRTIRGVLIPWGERSRTSVSKTKPVVFPRGSVPIPRDPSIVGLNEMHDRFEPRGHAVELIDEPVGMVAEFRIADTPEGDAYLAEPGNLRRLSPEVKALKRNPDGTGSAILTGAALVDEGAFASAALFAIDQEPDPEDPEDTSKPATSSSEETSTEDPEPEEGSETDPGNPDDTEGKDTVTETEVPNTLTTTPPGTPKPVTKGEMFALLGAVFSRRATPDMVKRLEDNWGGIGEEALFALSDIDYDGTDGVGAKMVQAAWLGEVLDGTTYQPRFVGLFGHKDLTQLAMGGWKWGTKPAGGAWAGNKAAIPSNTPTITPVTENASRWAGGHDHAREHRDFNTPGYWEAYYAAMVESYFKWLDEDIVLTEALAASTELEADNPAGLTIGSAMSKVIDGAVSVVAAGLIPTFSVLPIADYKQILKTPNSDVLGYLNASIGLEAGTLENAGFQFRGSSEVTNVLVGARSAADVYELPGSPVRAEALNIANGGIDTGLYGYGGLHVKNAAGIVEVTPYTP